ncbi:hypothetical protein ACH5RR_036112 [Cinchona calisaya]|uniref:HTH myb-type domain-containing protein n=1 Tax=Cinchona calisaya TaxID=153742 RepID=A0ABD2Y7R8_9GENT
MNMINHQNHISSNYNEKMQRTQDYIDALEEERTKILVFQRELPLCLALATQAIEGCKQQLSGGALTEYNFNGQSECSEQTSTDEGPVLEEFIPIKRALSYDDDDEEQQSHKSKKSNTNNNNGNNKAAAASKKSDWLRSVQLWNQTPDPPKTEELPKKVAVMEVKKNGSGGAFRPFKKEKEKSVAAANAGNKAEAPPPVPVAEASSTEETGGCNGEGNNVGSRKEEEKEGQSQRKSRRCWSPELHKRFLLALQQLGGAHVATPKQIRELMKVDGLTNDEVKSHLQKYRLHNRRPASSIHSINNNPQAPQFVVVGGIWVPPPDQYAGMAAINGSGEVANSNGIYAPIPTLPPPFHQDPSSASLKQRQKHNKQFHSDDDHHHSSGGGGVSSNSPSTSSSTDTTTTSPAY